MLVTQYYTINDMADVATLSCLHNPVSGASLALPSNTLSKQSTDFYTKLLTPRLRKRPQWRQLQVDGANGPHLQRPWRP